MILSNVLFKIKIIVEWNIHVKKKKILKYYTILLLT